MSNVSPTQIAARLDDLLKPPGSLGHLERLAARLCEIQDRLSPQSQPRRLVLFAADHGVADAKVTAWPASITRTMVSTIRRGQSASAVLARTTGTQLTLVDAGVLSPDDFAEPEDPQVTFHAQPIRAGTRNLANEPALTVEEFRQAIALGRRHATSATDDGMRVIATGEMGIGNTTPAACLSMLLANVPLDNAVGRGAGVSDDGLAIKQRVVADAVSRARKLGDDDPVAAVASVAGLEIAAMAGLMMQAHQEKMTIVLDGYVATSAALIAEMLQAGTVKSMLAAHRSAEPGHRQVLEHLRLPAFLEWDLRLGEGTGALLLMPALDAAVALLAEMGTFSELDLREDES